MKRLLITVVGSVQGVGFRPFIYRLAHQHNLVGSVKNTSSGVTIDIQGKNDDVLNFQNNLLTMKPERASICSVTSTKAPIHEVQNFEIHQSKTSPTTDLALLPDTAICSTCLSELVDPTNRRYHYPFIHCTSCGPRFSLFTSMPFDRGNTTMIDFPMCDECQKEYINPNDRRFYSQTTCCPKCGPKLRLLTPQQQEIATSHDAVKETITHLQQGKIIALKNTGGYLLLADATNESAVERLRTLKRRPKKPFALLVQYLEFARQIACMTPESEQVITSCMSPIVLVRKKTFSSNIAPSVAKSSPYYGMMLPHNALQHLILNEIQRPLIATSGNISGHPICMTEEEAFTELSHVADAFLIHNRRIIHRLDDSVVQMVAGHPTLIRRARGYIPHAISIPERIQISTNMLAAGSQLKNTFAFATKNKLYISQHIGDLDSCKSCTMYDNEVTSWEQLLKVQPSIGIRDIHPDYYTTSYIQNRQLEEQSIQHHKAHIYACMLENQIIPPLLGISWDGSGYGEDKTVWGGEAFVLQENTMHRVASVYPFPLPGSEKAVREPRYSALGILYAMGIPSLFTPWLKTTFSDDELLVTVQALEKKINAPLCSSIGRLFDGVSALLDCCHTSSFEGEAALALEALAIQAKGTKRYEIPLVDGYLDWRKMVQQIYFDKIHGIPTQEIALAFHLALSDSIVTIAKTTGVQNIVLTGGVMQNTLLLESIITKLKEAHFTPFWHHAIPPNDGGLSVGQLYGAISCA